MDEKRFIVKFDRFFCQGDKDSVESKFASIFGYIRYDKTTKDLRELRDLLEEEIIRYEEYLEEVKKAYDEAWEKEEGEKEINDGQE